MSETREQGRHDTSFVTGEPLRNGRAVISGTKGRPRKYSTSADRQHAYRERHKRRTPAVLAEVLRVEFVEGGQVRVTMSKRAFLDTFVPPELQAYVEKLRKVACPHCHGTVWAWSPAWSPDGRWRCAKGCEHAQTST